jgi:Flp pilus assembly protein TadG
VAAEFVLVLPVLLAIVLGVIDWGWYFCVREAAINASREGARTASLLGNTTTDGVTRANAYLSQAGMCSTPGATAGAGACNATGTLCNVTVSCNQVVLTGFFPAALIPTTLTVSTEMRHE